MKTNNIIIIIPTKGIGGSEKRIIGFWLYAQTHFSENIRLIMTNELYAQLTNVDELSGIADFKSNIIFEDINSGSLFAYKKDIRRILNTHVKSTDVLHFVSSFPLFNRIPNKTIFSFTESSFNNVNITGKLIYYISCLRATCVDVLDPLVYQRLKRLPFYSKKVYATPNSFIDSKFFTDIDWGRKENRITHLGRFHEKKRIDQFVTAIPEINALLRENGIPDASYHIIGYGDMEDSFRKILAGPEYKDIDCRIFFTKNPMPELLKSKVILSIQGDNNYPSKALLEGIVAGNIPVVTDVGTTEMIAARASSYYLDKNFSAPDLAKHILAILTLGPEQFREKAEAGIGFIKENFTIEKMAAYYRSVYNK